MSLVIIRKTLFETDFYESEGKMSDKERYKLDMEQLYSHWKLKEPAIRLVSTKSGEGEKIIINHRNNIFISDGVVYPEVWYSQNVRVLFLLKEAYTKNGNSDWDLVKDHLLLKEKKMSHLFKRICQWTQGILNTSQDDIPAFFSGLSDNHYGNDILKQIAVVNVKKSGGKANSSMEEINQYAEYDSEELKKELEIIDPTVIVCGYTISSLNIIMGTEIKDYDSPNENWFYSTQLNEHDVIVLDYYHPANQYPDLLNYYGLLGIYQQALKNNGKGKQINRKRE